MDSDSEPLVLSPYALAALAEFNAEKDAHEGRFRRLEAEAEERSTCDGHAPLGMDMFAEDWNMSQFWYSDETAHALASALIRDARSTDVIAIISAPSVFIALKRIIQGEQRHGRGDSSSPSLVLLEHDNRFAVFSEFVFYDFNQPLKLPANLKGSVDRLICDPPFLSEDCQTKDDPILTTDAAAMTAKWLAKSSPNAIVCTGERMEELVLKLYRSWNIRTTSFEPVHARGLSNEFLCYANFKNSNWTWAEGGSKASGQSTRV